jgi:hypothetical protein
VHAKHMATNQANCSTILVLTEVPVVNSKMYNFSTHNR